MKKVYLDHSATTPVHPRAAVAAMNCMLNDYGNSSSVHSFGRRAEELMEEARSRVADFIGADPEEIIFTGGATEADNLAIRGVAGASRKRGKHIITTAVEHHAILHTCDALEREGFRVTRVGVDSSGRVDPGDIEAAIEDDTILISVMLANNEIGTIQPIAEIAAIGREREIPVHTDAVQAAGQIPVDVGELGVDLASFSAHKMYGPKGVGCLYVRRGTRIQPQVHGGHHERRLRAGTENVPGIVAFGEACAVAAEEMDYRMKHMTALRDRLIAGLEERIPDLFVNGDRTQRLPNNVSVCIPGVEGEAMLLHLDMKGIAASSGSACTSGSLEASHVLLAMGLKHEIAHGSLRLTLGRENTAREIDYVLETLPPIVEKLRAMSAWRPGEDDIIEE
ncbi:MAG: cysteine desulfurase NifS [Bacillota bacterium]